MRYYCNAGPPKGPLLYRDVPGVLGVLEVPDQPMPIGTAFCIGKTAAGVALWELIVHGTELAGNWVLIDRRFRRAW